MEIFSKRLKELREENNVSLNDLAEAIGSTKSALSKYERGIVTPSLTVACKIAEYFGESLDYIAGTKYGKKSTEEERLFKKIEKSDIPIEKIERMIDLLKER